MEPCVSKQPAAGMSQPLLMRTFGSNYGSVGTQLGSETSFQVDPAVLARTMQVMASQMAASQSQQRTVPIITQATLQQTLTLEEGQYTGSTQDGVPHGRGTLTYHPGSVRKKYEGEWEKGKFHGRGVLRFSNEDRHEGQWKQGELHGQGLQFFADGGKYEGSFINGKRHGYGSIRGSDGSTYEGGWADGYKHGEEGTLTWPDGDVYSGGWKNDNFHGYGKYKWASGDSYSGEWEDGKKQGQGTMRYTSGCKYEGSWENNKPHGQGSLTETNPEKVGIFRNGELWTGKLYCSTISGTSTLTYKDGVYQKGVLDYIFCCC